MMNEECMDITWCTHVVCEVRVGGEEKTLSLYVLTKNGKHVKQVMSLSQSACTTFMNESQLRSIVTPHNFVLPNNPLRFETTKCSKQRVEQSSARTLFSTMRSQVGVHRASFLKLCFLNNGYCRSCFWVQLRELLFLQMIFLSFQFMKCPWLDCPVEGPTRRRGPEE